MSLASLATYVLVDPTHVLDAEKAFVSLSLFNIIRMPISVLPFLIITIIQVSVTSIIISIELVLCIALPFILLGVIGHVCHVCPVGSEQQT